MSGCLDMRLWCVALAWTTCEPFLGLKGSHSYLIFPNPKNTDTGNSCSSIYPTQYSVCFGYECQDWSQALQSERALCNKVTKCGLQSYCNDAHLSVSCWFSEAFPDSVIMWVLLLSQIYNSGFLYTHFVSLEHNLYSVV